MADLPLQFDRPLFLWLLLLLIPTFFLARRSIGAQSRLKATIAFGVRTLVILLLTVALAHPIWEKRGEGLTVSIILDRSQSIPLPLKRSSMEFMAAAAEAKERDEDRIAVVAVAREASIAAMPDRYSAVQVSHDIGDLNATNLASAVNLALAIMPDDTANRIVLVSDGNENHDSVLSVAEIARANGVPIDVLILEYEHANEVLFERIVAPTRARRGQSVNLRLVLRSQSEADGTIQMLLNDEPFDLNGSDSGTGFPITLEPGVRVVNVPISLDQPGPQRFEAFFEPADRNVDRIDRNNRAMAVTFVGSEGKVLVIDDGVTESANLVEVLRLGDIAVDVLPPDAVGDLIFLTSYDAVVLANIPRWAFDDEQVRSLHAYTHDLGGGLVMLGGPNSFGAGGWIDSLLARALPVKLDPPQTRQMPRGALALIMHSCEMPQGNYWGQVVAESAIGALSRLDYVGIVEYNWNNQVGAIGGCSWAHPMSINDPKSAAIAATKQMVVGDMPAFDPSMQLALKGLNSIRAGQKHAIIISDGDPSPPSNALVQSYIDSNVTVTTIMVAGHGSPGDQASMKSVASRTGGRFHNVNNPKNLPQIFIKEAQLISRSLIQEGDVYQPQVFSALPGPTRGVTSVPPLTGYILTAPRDGLAQTSMVVGTEEGADPILASWNYGLGRSIAFTSDITGRWGSAWPNWGAFKSFWEQNIRWVMRRSSPSNMIINTHTEGDRSVIEIEALDANASSLNFLRTNAVVVTPDTEAEPIALQQIGPGRYRGEFQTSKAGAYLCNVNFVGGTSENPIEGNLQAAITVPYSREFQAVRHNSSLLRDLADRTGGRVLSAADPELVDLFDGSDLKIPKSPKHIWDLLAILAASLFVIDVATRRLAVDPKWISGLFARAVGRRGKVSDDSLKAYKSARTHVEHRRRPAAASDDADIDSTARFEASEADKHRAIDVGTESPDDVRDIEAHTERRPTKEKPGDEDDGDFTSRLLRAKRRALGEDDPPGSPDA